MAKDKKSEKKAEAKPKAKPEEISDKPKVIV